MTDDDLGLEAIVRRLDDERQIHNLLARISHLADRGSIDDYLALWTDDGMWEGSADVARGKDEMRARVEAYRARGVQGPGSQARHVSTTRYVEFVSADSARAESYFVYFVDVNTQPRPARVGRYVDELQRTGAQWRLRRRRLILTD